MPPEKNFYYKLVAPPVVHHLYQTRNVPSPSFLGVCAWCCRLYLTIVKGWEVVRRHQAG